MATNLLIENYVPVVRQAKQIRTKYPINLVGTSATLVVGGTLAVTGATTLTGALTATGGVVGSVKTTVVQSAATGATVVLTAAQSGFVFQNASTGGSPSWTLPAVANGLIYTFTTANTTTGFTVTGAQVIHAKTSASGTAITTTTTLTNTQGTAVVGDAITIVGDGTAWWVTAQTGIFAAS